MTRVLPPSLISLIPIPRRPSWANQEEYQILNRYFERFIRTFGVGNEDARAKLWEDVFEAFEAAGEEVTENKRLQIKNWYNRQNLVIQTLRIVAERFPETSRAPPNSDAHPKQTEVIVIDDDSQPAVVKNEEGVAGNQPKVSHPPAFTHRAANVSVATSSRALPARQRETGDAVASSKTVPAGQPEPNGAESHHNAAITVSLADFDALFHPTITTGDPPTIAMPRPTPFQICTISGMTSRQVVNILEERWIPGRGREITFALGLTISPVKKECRLNPRGATITISDNRNTFIVTVPLPRGYKDEDFTWNCGCNGPLILSVVLPPQ
ncbi:hypothetical protein ONZ45_g13455 [Pleurotus djamor]|nr:hypothetical protein ONZ45_g13455 [Pleurotus djamor]